MNNTKIIKPVGIGLTFAIGSQFVISAEKPLNIIIIQTDEHHPTMYGASGDPIAITPNLDKIAKQGVVFTNAYCQNPISTPSRMSMLTGRYSQSINVLDNSHPLTKEFKTYADIFNKKGYTSAIIGKMHFRGKGEELRHGFERPYGDAGSDNSDDDFQTAELEKIEKKKLRGRDPKDARVSDFSMNTSKDGGIVPYTQKFLTENKDNPFLLICSFYKPHFPFEASREYHEMYKGRVKLPVDFNSDKKNWPVSSHLENKEYKFDQLSKKEIIHAREVYYAMITWVDDQIGLILDELERLGLKDNTLIIYTSDHGELAGEHGLWYKNSFYEGSVGIPFVVSHPKTIKTNQLNHTITGNIDIFPTICDAAGIKKPDWLEGKSLWPVLQGQESGNDRYIFSETYRSNIPGCMVRYQQWKYFEYMPCANNNFKKEVFLFDLLNDPNEMRNLAYLDEHKKTVENLEKKIKDWWKPEQNVLKLKKKKSK